MIYLDPTDKIEIILPHHQNWPSDKQPVFIVHPPTVGESLKIERLIDGLTGKSTEEQSKSYTELLKLCLGGWRNLRNRDGSEVASGDFASLDERLGVDQKGELVSRVINLREVPEAAAGESDLQSPTAGAASASPARADDAPNAPAQPNRF